MFVSGRLNLRVHIFKAATLEFRCDMSWKTDFVLKFVTDEVQMILWRGSLYHSYKNLLNVIFTSAQLKSLLRVGNSRIELLAAFVLTVRKKTRAHNRKHAARDGVGTPRQWKIATRVRQAGFASLYVDARPAARPGPASLPFTPL